MHVQRLYIYRYGATNACALTGDKGGSRLPAPLATDQWRFWMRVSCHQIENGLFGFALDIALSQIAAKGYYLFTHSIRLLHTRAGPGASSPGGTGQHRRSTTLVVKTAVMAKAHRLLCSASYDPDTFNMLAEVLDEVWASISSGFGKDFREIEAARMQLATIVLDLAMDGQLGQLQITRTAARLMRENHMSTTQIF